MEDAPEPSDGVRVAFQVSVLLIAVGLVIVGLGVRYAGSNGHPSHKRSQGAGAARWSASPIHGAEQRGVLHAHGIHHV